MLGRQCQEALSRPRQGQREGLHNACGMMFSTRLLHAARLAGSLGCWSDGCSSGMLRMKRSGSVRRLGHLGRLQRLPDPSCELNSTSGRSYLNAPPLTPLVVRFGLVGDMVLHTPLLHLLRRRYGLPCRLLTSGHWSSELFAGSADVSEIWELRARHRPLLLSPERWRVIGALRSHGGPVYVTEEGTRYAGKIRRLLALAAIEPARCVFLSEQPQQDEHWVDRLLRFGALTPPALHAEGYPSPAADASNAPHLEVHPADREDRDAWLHRRGLSGHELILLQPGNKRAIRHARRSQDDPKAWPINRWSALVQAIHASMPMARILLCGSPSEAGLLRDMRTAAGVDGVEVAADDLPLRRLLAIMEVAHSMVAVDTGPAHMAAAIDCPLVVLYGTGSPREWGRRSPSGSPVIELGGPPEHQSAAEIPLDQVVDAWLRMAHR